MGSKDELKEVDIKNRACYYFDDIVNGIDINFSSILWGKNLYENIFLQNFNGSKTIAFNVW